MEQLSLFRIFQIEHFVSDYLYLLTKCGMQGVRFQVVLPGEVQSQQTHNGSERTPPAWGTSRLRTQWEDDDDDLLLSSVGS